MNDVEKFIDNFFEEPIDKLENGIPDKKKYESYTKALEIAKKWSKEGRISSLEYDDPDESLVGSEIIIELKNEDFKNEEECKELLEYFSSFDQIGIYGTTDESVEIACLTFIYH